MGSRSYFPLGRGRGNARLTGDRARDAGRWGDAAAAYRRHLARMPDDSAIWVQLGHALARLGRRDEADRAYGFALMLAPSDADALLCRGHNRLQADDIDGAVAFYRESVALDGNADAAEALARLVPPEAEPEPDAASEEFATVEVQPEPLYAGRIEGVTGTTIEGELVALAGQSRAEVAFFDEGRRVGAGFVEVGEAGATGRFRVIVDVADERVLVARRVGDGAELEGSPLAVAPEPPFEDEHRSPATRTWLEELKAFSIAPGAEMALLVTHSLTGALKPHVLPYARALEQAGVAVILIVVTDHPVNVPPAVIDALSGVLVRQNKGYDFAAWSHVMQQYPEVYGAETLYLLNDSVVVSPTRLAGVLGRVRIARADIVGLTESHEHGWHIQSYFLALKPRTLASFWFQNFIRGIRILDDKFEIIRAYEVRLAAEAERAGLVTEVLFPSAIPLNPTLFAWRELLADGFPFIKLLPLRGAFPEADFEGWAAVAGAHDFDVALIQATVAANAQDIPCDERHRLSSHPLKRFGGIDRPLRVAYLGPSNYDNGLGVAGRGLVAALRHAGVLLNVHPIKLPFHIHKPVAPPVDICDFDGRADVAIIHLNPDSWFFLDDRQREIVHQAHTRVGYFVWEMAHLPDSWRHFDAVDRIWAPSRYCAELFEAQDVVPVDVVPHLVELPTPRILPPTDPMGLPALAGRRVILYMFDGASYIGRKNPQALIRSFAASGLAARGWTLVLKTKHLMDRPGDGAALQAHAAREPGVILIDSRLSAEALHVLWMKSEIYASSHSSEGFGLTIAEAMAAGKYVVATDFGGSQDFLDATTGYPVACKVVRLEEDMGHYTLGGEWAQVDEPALAVALQQAAEAAENGDRTKPEAAGARIATQFSQQAVADIVKRGLAAVMREGGGSNAPLFYEKPSLLAGLPVEHGVFGGRVRVVPLAPDGAPLAPRNNADTERGEEWVVFAPEGARFSPMLPAVLERAATRRPDVALFYADDVACEADQPNNRLRLKPAFDRALLCAQDYIGAPLMVRASALARIGMPDRRHGTAALADLLFRADAAGLSIERITEVLLAYPGGRVLAQADDYRMMLAAQSVLSNFDILPARAEGCFNVKRRFDVSNAPPVTIVTPTAGREGLNGELYIERLLAGIARTDWPMDRLQVLVGDDSPDSPGWASMALPFALTRIETARPASVPFNYAAKMNRLWRAASSELIVFMNDDLQPVDPGWLRALLTFAVDETVGGVGARLLYEDGRLQHAGMAPHGSNAGHLWVNRRRVQGTYQHWALVHREWSTVTGALFATRRSVLERMDGFDERFSLEFNDTDLCLRMRAYGYRIVCTPDAEMIHVEKGSRGLTPFAGDQAALFTSRWRDWLDHDPSWHPQLRRDRLEVAPSPQHEPWYR